MFIAALIALNIPVYLLLGWLIFDTKDNAADSFFDAIVLILKEAFVPPFIRWMIWEVQDDHDASNAFQLIGFFGSCIAVTAGEWYLITTYVWPELK